MPAGLGLAALLLACGGADRTGAPPSLLLLTLDTTRPDHLGCYGNQRVETPSLDRLARSGVRFENAFTPVPSTLPSHCSILTGLHPAGHGVHDNGVYRLEDSIPTLAERLEGAGYRTAAFVSAFVLDRRFGLARGFEVYDDEMEIPLLARDPEALERAEHLPEATRQWLARQGLPYQRRAEVTTRRAIDWLEALPEARPEARPEPFFLWVHYFDPHMSYQAPEPWGTRYDPGYMGELDGDMQSFLRVARESGWGSLEQIPTAEIEHMIARYDGEIAYMDHSIGRLLAVLDEHERFEETLVVAVGDHGEGFGEHGQLWEHNGQIFDEVMRVPLILKRPGNRGAGTVVERLASTLDLTPTLLAELGLPPLEAISGIRLFPPREEERRERRHLLLEALRERQAMPVPYSWLGLRGERFKLILHLQEERLLKSGFYDLEADPRERESRHQLHPEILERFTRQTLSEYDRLRSSAATEEAPLDERTRKGLEALGYVD